MIDLSIIEKICIVGTQLTTHNLSDNLSDNSNWQMTAAHLRMTAAHLRMTAAHLRMTDDDSSVGFQIDSIFHTPVHAARRNRNSGKRSLGHAIGMDSNALRGAAFAADATSSTALLPAACTAPTPCPTAPPIMSSSPRPKRWRSSHANATAKAANSMYSWCVLVLLPPWLCFRIFLLEKH